MYTLKIKWYRYEEQQVDHGTHGGPERVLVDEATYFIPADEISVHGLIRGVDDTMNHWPEGSYFTYRVAGQNARVIEAKHQGVSTWYLASHAWIMSDTGKTIERLI